MPGLDGVAYVRFSAVDIFVVLLLLLSLLLLIATQWSGGGIILERVVLAVGFSAQWSFSFSLKFRAGRDGHR